MLFSYNVNSNSWFGINNGGLSSPLNVQGLNNTFGVPPASPATIKTITNAGGISTMNCDIADCGLTISEQIELGTSVPLSCQGPQTISAVSGNSASFPSTTCAASGGPYASSIGQYCRRYSFAIASRRTAARRCRCSTMELSSALDVRQFDVRFINLDTDSVAALVSINGGSLLPT